MRRFLLFLFGKYRACQYDGYSWQTRYYSKEYSSFGEKESVNARELTLFEAQRIVDTQRGSSVFSYYYEKIK